MTNLHSRLVAGACPIVLTLVSGCQQAATPSVTSTVYEAAPPVAAAPAPAPPPPVTAVRVAPDILSACGIDGAPGGVTPLFAFDSSAISIDGQSLLDDVARCFTTGPLAGRALRLIGRADPRGTDAYNVSLGDRRASGVESYLRHQGMVVFNLRQSSRGALDALGTDESGWAMDRRVDVELAAESVTVGSNP